MSSSSRWALPLLLTTLLACGGGGGATSAPTPSGPPAVATRPTPAPEAAAPTTPTGLANLVAFTRLAGYVRHFHPTGAVGSADWGTVVREGMKAVEGAADPAELAARLQAQMADLAPLVQVFPEGTNPPLPPELLAPPASADRFQWWDNLGWSPDPPVHLSFNPYHQRLTRGLQAQIPAGVTLPSAPFEASLGAGVRCRVPLSLYADATDALPRAKGQAWRYASLHPDDRATRLADIALFWNVIQHHHPYLDLLPAPWTDQLAPSLAQAAKDADARAFASTLSALYALLQDSHGYFLDPYGPTLGAPPLVLAYSDEGWVVAQVLTGAPAGLAAGDRILNVDGQPIADLWADFELHTTGSPQWRKVGGRRHLLMGPAGSSVTLDVEAMDGTPKTFTAARSILTWAGWGGIAPILPQPAHGSELRPGLLYLDLSQLNTASFNALMPKILAAKGIIADRRRYYSASGTDAFQDLFQMALTAPTSGGLRVAVPRPLPDQPLAGFDPSDWDGLAPSGTPLTGKLVFIQDALAISYSETLMTWVQASNLPILGEASAGADGSVTYATLPGGYDLNFTGMRCLKADGSQLQIRGITPTHPVGYTRAALAQGKDDLIEAAIALLQGP